MLDMKTIGITWKRLLILGVFCLPFILLHQSQNELIHKKSLFVEGSTSPEQDNNSLNTHNDKSVATSNTKPRDCLKHPKGCQVYGEPVRVELNITWTKSNVAKRQQIYEQRKRQVSNGCQTLDENVFQPNANHVLDRSLWNDKKHFIWCPILKTGSSLWMRILAKTYKLRAPKLRQKLRRTYKAPIEKDKKLKYLKSFTKFFIVRHPFERLLSAYRDKMLSELTADNLFRPLQIKIAKKYSWDPASNATSKTNNKIIQYLSKTTVNGTEWVHPTFVQFLLHVQEEMQQLWNAKGDFEINGHWSPYWYSCAPCLVNYDIIARMETIDIDNGFIIHQSNLNPRFNKREHSAITDHFKSTNEAAKHYFGQVPLWLMKDLFRLYLPDFHIFGYDPIKFYNLAQK